MKENQYFRTVELSSPRFTQPGIRHMTVKSPALGRRGDISFYVPPQAASQGCQALLLLLNGVYNSHWGWLYHAGVHITLQRLIDSGATRPMVLAMPSDGLWGDGSAYLPHGSEDAERWIMEDAIEASLLAAPELRRPPKLFPKLFLAGLSMGGYGALRLGAKWAARISGVSAHSAITRISEMAQFAEEPLVCYSAENSDELDPLYWMKEHRDALPPIRFDCGVDDPLLPGNRLLHRALVEEGIEHSYQEFPGGHEWPYWEEHVERTILFCEAEMRKLDRRDADAAESAQTEVAASPGKRSV
jgi:esterase/lipase superfamily enzyme